MSERTETEVGLPTGTRSAAGPFERRAGELAGRVTARSDSEGLLDVAYTVTDSPFGKLLVASSGAGLVAVGLPGSSFEALLERIAHEISPRVLESPARTEPVRRRLDDYFSGRLTEFDLTLDRRLIRGFMRRALERVAAVPYGATTSYAEIAAEAGSPRAHRAAGSACATNPIPIVIPCHRVLRSGGALGDYGGGLEMKRALLELERAFRS